MADNNFGFVPTPTTPTASTNNFGFKPTVAPNPAVTAPKQSLADSIWSGLVVGGAKAVAGYTNGVLDSTSAPLTQAMTDVNNDQNSSTSGKQNPLNAGIDIAGDLAKGTVGAVGGAINSGVVQPLATLFGSSPALQKIATSHYSVVPALLDQLDGATKALVSGWNTFAQANPNGAKKIADAGNILQFMTLFAPENPEVADKASQIVDSTIQAGKETAGGAVNLAQDAVTGIKNKVGDIVESQVAKAKVKAVDEFNQEINKQDTKTYNQAQRADAKGNNIPQILTDRGVTSHSLVGEDGRFNTSTQATKITQEANNLYDTTIKPLVQSADSVGVKVPLSEIQNRAIDNVSSAKIPTGIKADVISRIKSEFSASGDSSLSDKFGENGISLNQAETEKHAHWGEINWSKIGGKTTAENIFNRSMGNAYQTALENNLGVSSDAVKAMNAHIGGLRDTADFLNSIDGDKPAVQPSKGLTGRIINKGIKIGGGALGELLGGGPLGGIGGYVLTGDVANAITDFITKLPQTARDYWLSDLQAKNPQVYDQIQGYLRNEEQARSTRLALPPASSVQVPPGGFVAQTGATDSNFPIDAPVNQGKSGIVAPTKPGGLYEYLRNLEASQKSALGKNTKPLTK